LAVLTRLFIALLIVLASIPALAFEWEYLGMDGIVATCINADPVHGRILVGTLEGFWFYDQASGNWTEHDEEGWIGRTVWTVDYSDQHPDRIITGRENAWFKGYMEYSDDLGETGHFVYESEGGRVTDLIHDEDVQLACTWSDIVSGELIRSTDGGVSWTLMGNPMQAMTDLTLDSSGPTFYLSGSGLVMRSEDEGQSWSDYSGDLPEGYGVYCVEQLSPSGEDPRGLLASNDLGIYHTADGIAWTRVNASSCRNMDARAVSGGPVAAVGWSGDLLFSPGDVNDWRAETGDLGGTPLDVVFSEWDGGLYVVTQDSGVFRAYGFPSAAPEPAADRFALRAWPTPFNPSTRIRFELPEAGPTELVVFDPRGRRVAVLISDDLAPGSHEVAWRAEGLASGIYLAKLKTASGSASIPLLLLK